MAGFLLDSKGGEIYILTALAGHSTSVLDPVGSKTIKNFGVANGRRYAI